MKRIDSGWIALSRKMKEHWLYPQKRAFTKYEAWIDLLLEANFSSSKIINGTKKITIEPGQLLTSKEKLKKKWRWGKQKLNTYLSTLVTDDMITIKSDNAKTIITILNYTNYQSIPESNKTDKDDFPGRPISQHPNQRLNEQNRHQNGHIPANTPATYNKNKQELNKNKQYLSNSENLKIDLNQICSDAFLNWIEKYDNYTKAHEAWLIWDKLPTTQHSKILLHTIEFVEVFSKSTRPTPDQYLKSKTYLDKITHLKNAFLSKPIVDSNNNPLIDHYGS